jgi:hypothetical protein
MATKITVVDESKTENYITLLTDGGVFRELDGRIKLYWEAF